jgi:hypothetical protein
MDNSVAILVWRSRYATLAAVAQPVEQRIRNAWVGGSNPLRGTNKQNIKINGLAG